MVTLSSPPDLTTLVDHHFRAPVPVPERYPPDGQGTRRVHRRRAANRTPRQPPEFASESTAKTHAGAIVRKLGLRDRVQIVVFA